jgi:hypothetical protein
MVPLALLLAAAAAGAVDAPALVTAPAKVERVLVLETRADATYLPKVKAFGDLLATILEQRTTAEIVPSSSVKDRLAVAADKLSAGCDDTACMSEIAGALDARWVVASRASQVGGRWLMRVELFDSQTLKVTAQVSAMADSVEGLAAQAEHIADDLVAKAPVLSKKAGGPDVASAPPPESSDKPAKASDDGGGGNPLPWILAAGGGTLSIAFLAASVASYSWASGKETDLNKALDAYAREDSTRNRKALAAAGNAADDSSVVNNCLIAPLGCLSLPLAAVAVTGVYWGATQGKHDDGAGPSE